MLLLQAVFYLGPDKIYLRWINDAIIILKKGERALNGNFYFGLLEKDEMKFLMDALDEEFKFYDVGANAGSYTIIASKVCGAATKAIEPCPDNRMYLNENIKINGIQHLATILPFALTYSSDIKTVNLTKGLGAMNNIVETDIADTIMVEASTLDHIHDSHCDKPSVIKIDTEGHEYLVLQGATELLLSELTAALIIENNDQRCGQLLSKYGYRAYSYDSRRKQLLQLCNSEPRNIIWVKDLWVSRLQTKLQNSSNADLAM